MGCRGRASIAKRVVRSTHSLYVRRVSKSGMFEELEGGVVKRHFFVGGRYGVRGKRGQGGGRSSIYCCGWSSDCEIPPRQAIQILVLWSRESKSAHVSVGLSRVSEERERRTAEQLPHEFSEVYSSFGNEVKRELSSVPAKGNPTCQ